MSSVFDTGWAQDLWYVAFPLNLVSNTGHKSALLWIIWTGYEPCTPGSLGLPSRPPSCSCVIFYSCYFNIHILSVCSTPRTHPLALPLHPQPIPVIMADNSTSSSTPSFPKLCSSNYSTWKGKMKAFLHTKGLWTIVSGAEKCPDDSKANLQAKWDVRADKAAGQLYLSLSLSLCWTKDTYRHCPR